MVPKGYSLFGLPVRGQSFHFPATFLLFFLFLVAEMNFAIRVRANLDETPFLHAVRMNAGRQVVAEFVFGKRVLALVVFPRDDLHVLAAWQSGRFVRCAVAVRNLYKIRQLGDALRNMSVELAIETRGIRTLCGIWLVLLPDVWPWRFRSVSFDGSAISEFPQIHKRGVVAVSGSARTGGDHVRCVQAWARELYEATRPGQ
jgi:hypothetical protein